MDAKVMMPSNRTQHEQPKWLMLAYRISDGIHQNFILIFLGSTRCDIWIALTL